MDVDLTVAMISATVQIDQPQETGPRIVGTGFLVQAPKPDGTPRTVLITAAHVLNNMPGQTARIGYRFQDQAGTWKFSAQPLPIRQGATQLWVRNPDRDIAAMEVKAPPEFARAAIPLSWLADENTFDQTHLGPGDEMLVLGFPEGLAANRPGFPILRAGRVASYPLTPIKEFPSFLLDFRVFSGNSGGPVFITEDTRRRPGAAGVSAKYVAGVLTQQTLASGQPMGLGIVTHAMYIRPTIALLDQATWIGEAAQTASASPMPSGPPPKPATTLTPAEISAPPR